MTLADIYGFVVVDCGISPEYFLDHMSTEEVGYLSKTYIKNYREKWEMFRMRNHAILATNSTKKLKLTDVMKFEWDNEEKVAKPVEDPKEAVERIRKKFNIQNNT